MIQRPWTSRVCRDRSLHGQFHGSYGKWRFGQRCRALQWMCDCFTKRGADWYISTGYTKTPYHIQHFVPGPSNGYCPTHTTTDIYSVVRCTPGGSTGRLFSKYGLFGGDKCTTTGDLLTGDGGHTTSVDRHGPFTSRSRD